MPIKFNHPTEVDIQNLKENVRYDPETGHFWWRKPSGNRDMTKPIGNSNGQGYLRFRVYGFSFSNHRAAFILMGEDLPDCVDHINRVKWDNRWENLRPADRRKNVVNAAFRSDNTQGYRGVIDHKMCKGWVAQGSDGRGKRVHLGVFTSKEEAALAYNIHAEKTYGPFAEFNQVF